MVAKIILIICVSLSLKFYVYHLKFLPHNMRVTFSPLDFGHLENKGHILFTLVSSFLITMPKPCQACLQLNWSLMLS